MPAQTKGQQEEHDKQMGQQLQALIGEQVMLVLGLPGELHSVQVRKLWRDHYRVNVFVGMDATSATVAHSYFLATDDDGRIISANPKIMRQYDSLQGRKDPSCKTP